MEKINWKDIKVGDCLLIKCKKLAYGWFYHTSVVREIVGYGENGKRILGDWWIGFDKNWKIICVSDSSMINNNDKKDKLEFFKLNKEETLEKYTKIIMLKELGNGD